MLGLHALQVKSLAVKLNLSHSRIVLGFLGLQFLLELLHRLISLSDPGFRRLDLLLQRSDGSRNLRVFAILDLLDVRRQHGFGALGEGFGVRPVLRTDDQVAVRLPHRRIGTGELDHRFSRLLPLRGVRRSGSHIHVVDADVQVVDGLSAHLLKGLLLTRINRGVTGRTVLTQQPDKPRAVVNLRGEVHEDSTQMPNGPVQVVLVVEGRGIPFPLASHDGLAGLLVTLLAKARVIHPQRALDVVLGKL